MVMTSYGVSGNGLIKFYSSFTVLHERSPAKGDLFRMDILNFSGPAANFNAETMKMEPGTRRTEITNEAGNWDFGDGPGKEGVAFLLTGKEAPIDTIGMYQSYKGAAEAVESAGDQSTFTVANASQDGRPVLNITRTLPSNGTTLTTVYEIDAATGNLLATQSPPDGGIRQEFDLSAAIDESEFEVPSSLVVAPVKDLDAARMYLYGQK